MDDEEIEEEQQFQEELQQWQKDRAGAGKAKPKYVYKTMDDLKDTATRHKSFYTKLVSIILEPNALYMYMYCTV